MTVYQSVKRAYEFSYAHTRDKGATVPMKEPRIQWEYVPPPADWDGSPRVATRAVENGWRRVPNTWITRHDDGSYSVTLYSTRILHVTRSGRVTLNTGGWDTVTTKERMNRFLRTAGYVVGSERSVWKVWRVPHWDPVAVFERHTSGLYRRDNTCSFLDRRPARVAEVSS